MKPGGISPGAAGTCSRLGDPAGVQSGPPRSPTVSGHAGAVSVPFPHAATASAERRFKTCFISAGQRAEEFSVSQQCQTLQIRKEKHENRVWFLTAHLLQLVIPHLARSSLQLLRTQQLPHAAPTPRERQRCSGRGCEAGTWESREKELPGPADGQSHHVPTGQVTHLVHPRSLLPKRPQTLGGPNRGGTGGLQLPAERSLPQIQDEGCPLWASEPAPNSSPRLSATHQPHGAVTHPWPWVKYNPNWAGGQCSPGCLERDAGGSPSLWVLKSKLDATAKETGGLIKMSPFRP